ncbi:MAG: right-handed parallel beta-helix repeat-containing protein [Candidatus Hydrogenedentes bacterium]|nr:right-handed parallel beta-helix repeat-containing protein [Candidatus Hydrogenedentota bacterium]
MLLSGIARNRLALYLAVCSPAAFAAPGMPDGLVQYYVFEEPGSAHAFPNRCTEGEALRARGGGDAESSAWQPVDGPFEDAPAVRLDKTPLAGPAPSIGERGFTLAAWVRIQGVGSIGGNPVTRGGTLFSFGSGYWDGWRVTVKPDEASAIGFEVGRPQPDHAQYLNGGHLLTGVWHHLAASWDGENMRVYIDGVQTAEQPHAHPFALPEKAGFVVGYAGSGWGSSLFDVADVALFDRALSPSEVMQSACRNAPLAAEGAAAFEAAWQAARAGDTAKAVAAFDALARGPIAPSYTATALIEAADALARGGQYAEAGQRLRTILERDDMPAFLRTRAFRHLSGLAQDEAATLPAECYQALLDYGEVPDATLDALRLGLARALLAQGDLAQAESVFRDVLTQQDLPARERFGLTLKLGHACRAQGRGDEARRWYAGIADAADAPFGFPSYARLCIGQSYLDERDWAHARAAFEALASDAQAPSHHRQEAQERAVEATRQAQGLPAFDPAASRTPAPQWPAPGMTYFVAPDGKPGNAGTKDAPFDGLRAARDAIRGLKQAGGLPAGGVLVSVAPGVYPAVETLAFTEEDSGTAAAPIIYRAAGPRAATLSGGTALTGFKPVKDEAVLARLPEEAHGKVFEIDLKAIGIDDYGTMAPRGATLGDRPLLELFFDGRAMQLARWPNEGYIRAGTVHDAGQAEPARGAVFDCTEERLARWADARDPWIFGFPQYLWADATLPVATIDADAGRVTLGAFYNYGLTKGAGGVKANMPFYFLNLLEEIDQPGEYYLDRVRGRLYFYPPAGLDTAPAELSLLAEPFIALHNVSHLAFEGLMLELGQTHGIAIQGGEHCLVAGCTVRKLGGNAVSIAGGKHHTVLGCDLAVLGMGGVHINAGDRASLARADHLVENCHVFDFSRIVRTYTPAVWIDGVGTRVAHNEFHHSPCHAIRLNGNEHALEFNNVYDVLLESDDQGGVDMWGNPTYRGNIIRYNYWHDMGGNGFPCGQAGVRLDDAISETVVYGNVFRRCSYGHFGGVQIHGGKENYIENNLFIDCAAAISFSRWGEGRWGEYLDRLQGAGTFTQTINIHEPPYSTRYPALAHLRENPDINRIWRNIAFACDEFMIRDGGRQEVMDNLFATQEPGFADATNGDYTLRPDADAFRLTGFRPIPFKAIGLYADEYRKEAP